MKVLITGANGWVGRAVLSSMSRVNGAITMGSVRNQLPNSDHDASRFVTVGDLNSHTDWSEALLGVEAVVHTAAKVHIMKDMSSDALAEYRETNADGTLNLARQAAASGVRRFVFVSSVKVNGEETQPGRPFRADDTPAPRDSYAISKLEAELGLQELSAKGKMEVVIIRPPLVYGPGVKANFASMMRWLRSGIPLPLGAIKNRRSLVALDNLVDLLMTCLTHPAAAGKIFLVSDNEDVSTTELLLRMGRAMGHPAHLIPVPESWLEMATTLAGRRDVARRLCSSLQVDIDNTCNVLGWRPVITLDQGLARTAVRPHVG